jgi:hypothetical protein
LASAGQLHGRRRKIGRQCAGAGVRDLTIETAIKVTDGTVEVVSEGHWKLFTP